MPTFTRREALAGLATAASSAAADKASSFIDAHVHVWTPDTVGFPHDPRHAGRQYKPDSFTPEQLLAVAKPAGVSRIVLIQMSFYQFDEALLPLDAGKSLTRILPQGVTAD